MSTTATKRMIDAYVQTAPPTLFLSGMFESPPQNFHNSEEVEIDIIRSEEDVSIVITDISAGYRMNSTDLYTNKAFKPPVHKEAITLNAFSLLKRTAGNDPFADVSFQQALAARIMTGMRAPEMKIHRAIELQASQILQTGIITLSDDTGTALYTLDYKPKATHFPDAAISWGTGGEDKLGDLESLCDVIREDGLAEADEIIFGAAAWRKFEADTTVQALLDNRRMTLGGVAPERRGMGAKYMGTIEIGDCSLGMWIYSGRYTHPQTGVSTRYVDEDKVIVRASAGRMDATFGAVPRIVAPDPRVAQFIPSRVMNTRGGMDLWPNVWIDERGENLSAGVSSRPLLIPTAIDTYGCLNTNP